MPITKQITLYTFEELSDRAKEKARDWWRSCETSDFDHEFIFEDAERVGALIGIEIDRHTYKTMGGGTGSAPTIYYSGFSSQGDGACFEGTYRYAKGGLKALAKEIGTVSKGDIELLRIARELQDIQKRYFYRLTATIKHRGHYNHSGCMVIDVEHDTQPYIVDYNLERELEQPLRAFADWIYDQLKSEYFWRMEDEQVDESITINGYTFTEEGRRED